MSKVTIYTDGSCSPNPGKGGWGAFMQFNCGKEIELSGGEAESTNNRMELMGAIMALESLETRHDIVIYTDSKYVKNGITQWINAWRRNGWVTKGKGPVKNKDLWIRLSDATGKHTVKWNWVKGHSGNKGNEKADLLANIGAGNSPPIKAPSEIEVLEERVSILEEEMAMLRGLLNA